MCSLRWHCSSARQSSVSVALPVGSRFSRREPFVNNVSTRRQQFLPKRTLEALRVLGDDGQARAKAVQPDRADVDTVDEDGSRLRLDDAVQHL